MTIPRGKYIGKRIGDTRYDDDESEHFIKCGECGGWIDCRDLGQVFDHSGGRTDIPGDFDVVNCEGERTYGAALDRARALVQR